jgi:glycine betaine/proline transport system substrate-binding protein
MTPQSRRPYKIKEHTMRTFKNLFGKSLAAATLALGLSSAMAADKPTLTLGYVNGWADSVATTHARL